MLNNFLEERILKYIDYTPTESQLKLSSLLASFITSTDENQVFILKGYAGTGKTTMINALVKTLKEIKNQFVLMAPTGRAAKVIAQYTGDPAHTIHKIIYRQAAFNEGFGSFKLNFNQYNQTIFIVDEASMIGESSSEEQVFGSGNLLDDLFSFVYSKPKNKLILIGDTAQLPPIGRSESSSLIAKQIQARGYAVVEMTLVDVVRQSNESEILVNATFLRNAIKKTHFTLPKLTFNNASDLKNLSGNDLIEILTNEYEKEGLDEVIVITRSNKLANIYNQGIRNRVLWREEEIASGDLLMVVKNNYFWLPKQEEVNFIANGDIIRIKRIKRYYELYGFRFADVTVTLPDYNDFELDTKIILDTITSNSSALTSEDNKRFFFAVMEDYEEIKSKRDKYLKLKENPFYNALQVKFAYAVTCHKAQGGQWKAVFIDHGYLTEELMNVDLVKWLYTAITRAKERVYLVNFNKKLINTKGEDG
jgi:exodeoxyribonuclease V